MVVSLLNPHPRPHTIVLLLLLLSTFHVLLFVDASAVLVTPTPTKPPHRRRSGAHWEGLGNSLASALAAGCSKTLLAPFDTLKTIQQQYSKSTGAALSLQDACALVMARPHGVMEFYAGIGVAVVGSMPSVGLYFGVYSYCKRLLGPWMHDTFGEGSKHRLPSHFLWTLSITTSAAIGNTVASFSRVPYEVVKQKLQAGVYTSTVQALTDMSRNGGMRAFFPLGGVSIQMIRDIPYAMVTLLCYEFIKQKMEPYKERYPKQSTLIDAFAGAIAGGIGSFVTNPMDVIKTRLQTSPELYGGSISACFAATWSEGGPEAFLRGSVPRLLHKVPANGFFFLFYEFFRSILMVEGASAGK